MNNELFSRLKDLAQKENRARLAVLLGAVAMLLILLSELFTPSEKTAAASAAPADDAQGGGKVCLLDGGGVAALNEAVSAAGGSDHARPFFPSLCPFHYTTFPCRAQSRRPSAFAGKFANLFGQTARFGHFRKETVTFSVQYSGKIVFRKGRF